MRTLKGHRYKNADGRDVYEVYDADSDFLDEIAVVLQSRFGFQQRGHTFCILDDVHMEFVKGDIVVILGWDNWSGCFMMSQQPAGDEYVLAVGELLDAMLKTS